MQTTKHGQALSGFVIWSLDADMSQEGEASAQRPTSVRLQTIG